MPRYGIREQGAFSLTDKKLLKLMDASGLIIRRPDTATAIIKEAFTKGDDMAKPFRKPAGDNLYVLHKNHKKEWDFLIARKRLDFKLKWADSNYL